MFTLNSNESQLWCPLADTEHCALMCLDRGRVVEVVTCTIYKQLGDRDTIAWYSTVGRLMTDYMSSLCLRVSHRGIPGSPYHTPPFTPLYVCCWASPVVAKSSRLNLTPSLPCISDIYYHTLPCQCRRLLLKHMCFCASRQPKPGVNRQAPGRHEKFRK